MQWRKLLWEIRYYGKCLAVGKPLWEITIDGITTDMNMRHHLAGGLHTLECSFVSANNQDDDDNRTNQMHVYKEIN